MQFELDLYRAAPGTISGTVGLPNGPTHPFSGLIELFAIVECLLDGDESRLEVSPDG